MQGQEGDEEVGRWPLARGTILGRYQIVRGLGEGGMGSVYEGRHVAIGKKVAIKVMSPELAAIPEARARFLLEAQLMSRVHHPHTVEVTDLVTEAGYLFIVMEYLEGDDLAHYIRRRAPLPLAEVVDIALPVVAAVAAAHDEGVVHRDLKPQNVFLARLPDGTIHPKVLDFGIAKAPAALDAAPITSSGVIVGSPSYFSPEQVSDPKAVSPATDQYALGLLIYECVTGRLPYDGSDLPNMFQAIVAGSCDPVGSYRPDLPVEFQQIIARAMSLEPGDRYPSVRHLGRELLPFASPKTRLVWENQLDDEGAPEAGTRVARGASAIPVTDQTPGPAQARLSVTVGLPAPPRLPDKPARPADALLRPDAPRLPDAPAPPPLPAESALALAGLALASPRAPDWSGGSEPSLSIPRRSPAAWMVGGALVLGAAVLGLFVLRRQTGPSAPARVVQPAAERVTLPAPAAPPAHPAPEARATSEARPAGAARGASAESPQPTTSRQRDPRQGRTGERQRFGPNRAPLIE